MRIHKSLIKIILIDTNFYYQRERENPRWGWEALTWGWKRGVEAVVWRETDIFSERKRERVKVNGWVQKEKDRRERVRKEGGWDTAGSMCNFCFNTHISCCWWTCLFLLMDPIRLLMPLPQFSYMASYGGGKIVGSQFHPFTISYVGKLWVLLRY